MIVPTASDLDDDRDLLRDPCHNKLQYYECNINVNKAALAIDNALCRAAVYQGRTMEQGRLPHIMTGCLDAGYLSELVNARLFQDVFLL